MIKIFKRFWSWIDDYNEEQYCETYSTENFVKLFKQIEEEFKFITLDDLKSVSDRVHYYPVLDLITIFDHMKNAEIRNYILKNIPDARVGSGSLGFSVSALEIKYNHLKYEEKVKEAMSCPIQNYILPNLKRIQSKLDDSSNKSFEALMNKYDDIFVTLHTTILDMKETTGIDEKDKETITDILQTFIEEFNSLEAVFNKRVELDQQAVKDSLKRRLDYELELVNKIKTNWNTELLDQEVKIEV